MSISSETARNNYVGSNSTAAYSYNFKIFEESELEVKERVIATGVETTLVLNSDYTVSGEGEATGGSIVLSAGNLASTKELSIQRILPITQPTDIRNQGDFYPEIHEDQFDRFIMIDLQQQDQIDRSIKLPSSVDPDDFDMTIPADIAGNAGSAIVVNATEDGFTLGVSTAGSDPNALPKAGGSMTGDLSMTTRTGIKFFRTNNANSTKIQASDSIAANETYTLPAAFPASSKYMKSSSAGVLDFDTADQILAAATSVGADLIASVKSVASVDPDLLQNFSLSTSVAASALTITLKDASGSSLSASDFARIAFRSSTATTGTTVVRNITSNLTLVVPSSATLGSQNAIADYLYIWAIDNAGTVELAVSGTQFYSASRIVSSTTISAAATALNTLYSTTGRSSVAARLIGRLLYTQTTAGTWASAGTTLDLAGVGTNLVYEEGSFTANFNSNAGGGSSANTSKTIKFTRNGNQVTLVYPDCSNMTAGASSASFLASGALLARLRPAAELDWVSVQMSSAGSFSTSPGNLSLRSNGDMYIFRNANASTSFGIGDVNNGCTATTLNYTTA